MLLYEVIVGVNSHGHKRISEVIGSGDKGTMEGVMYLLHMVGWGPAVELGGCGNKIAERDQKLAHTRTQ